MAKKRPIYGIVAALVMALGLGVFAGAASAQSAYPGGGVLTLSRTSASAGEAMTAHASGCEPGRPVSFVFNSDPIDIGTATADDEGVATIEFVVPSVANGVHTVTATCISATTGEVQVLSAQITVVPPGTDTGTGTGTGTGGTGTLPRTGSNSTDLLRVGALLVAAGGAVVLITRKRAQAKIDA